MHRFCVVVIVWVILTSLFFSVPCLPLPPFISASSCSLFSHIVFLLPEISYSRNFAFPSLSFSSPRYTIAIHLNTFRI